MTDVHLGRLVAASLHQAIGEELPQRLEFYENWLHSEGLRDGSIGLGPMLAVIGFLRTEGPGYDRVVGRAGALAAEWSLMTVGPFRRRMVRWLPGRLRMRAALRQAEAIVRAADSRTRLRVRTRRRTARIELSASVFCTVRAIQTAPLCGFYHAIVLTTLAHFGLDSTAEVNACRALGDTSCVISFRVGASDPLRATAAAA